MRPVAATLIAVTLTAACGSPSPAPPSSAPPAQTAAAPSKARELVVTRASVRETVQGGLGAFLAGVRLEDEPVYRDGRFHGFRLVSLAEPLTRSGLTKGDVIVRVNGRSIERPEQALAVFREAAGEPAIVVDFERDGAAAQLRIPIVGN